MTNSRGEERARFRSLLLLWRVIPWDCRGLRRGTSSGSKTIIESSPPSSSFILVLSNLTFVVRNTAALDARARAPHDPTVFTCTFKIHKANPEGAGGDPLSFPSREYSGSLIFRFGKTKLKIHVVSPSNIFPSPLLFISKFTRLVNRCCIGFFHCELIPSFFFFAFPDL